MAEGLREVCRSAGDARVTRTRGTETAIVVGDPVQELRDQAADLDMLVVGSHSRGALESVLMGSVSRRLAHSCPAPLAVVPPHAGP